VLIIQLHLKRLVLLNKELKKVWVVKVQVLACDPEPITTEDGNAYQWRVKWLVLGRNLAATITAS